jgi:hypothetical protein
VWKNKEIEQSRNRIRDCGTQLHLYLGLLQAEATAKASLAHATTAENTGNILQQILNEFGRIHERLDSIGDSVSTGEPTKDQSENVMSMTEPEVIKACCDLEESITRLSRLVDTDDSTLAAEDATEIIDALEKLIQSARDTVLEDRKSMCQHKELAMSEKKRRLQSELRMIGGMVCSAPLIEINPNSEYPRSSPTILYRP